MNLKDAVRLTSGTRITFGNSMWTAKINRVEEAVVVRVTPKGGILARDSTGREFWVPYHHVVRA